MILFGWPTNLNLKDINKLFLWEALHLRLFKYFWIPHGRDPFNLNAKVFVESNSDNFNSMQFQSNKEEQRWQVEYIKQVWNGNNRKKSWILLFKNLTYKFPFVITNSRQTKVFYTCQRIKWSFYVSLKHRQAIFILRIRFLKSWLWNDSYEIISQVRILPDVIANYQGSKRAHHGNRTWEKILIRKT